MELEPSRLSRDAAVTEDIEALKAALADRVLAVIHNRRMTNVEAERVTGFDRSEFSRLERGRLDLFKLDRLIRMLLLLGQDVSITAADRAIAAEV